MKIISFERWSTLRTKNTNVMNHTFCESPEMILIVNDPSLVNELVMLRRSKFNQLVADTFLFTSVDSCVKTK